MHKEKHNLKKEKEREPPLNTGDSRRQHTTMENAPVKKKRKGKEKGKYKCRTKKKNPPSPLSNSLYLKRKLLKKEI